MAPTPAIPPFLLPRGGLSKSSFQYLRNTLPTLQRTGLQPSRVNRPNFSSSSSHGALPPKPRVLEKPDQFRPPSHPAHRVVNPNKRTPRNYPGPPPSQKEIADRQTKRYPNMFPPEGTVLYKFLTNKGIHLWISLSVLFTLASFTWSRNFMVNSPYGHLLPPWSGLLTGPISTIRQFFTVLKMDAQHTTMISKEKRKMAVDDIDKRKEYRIAHGLEKDDRENADGTEVEGNAVGGEGTASMKNPKRWLGIW
ncbi:hypothetical protein FQN49_002149 [Arthroderma sp. PD_2]|nr:hypothetical protein FQN49_002149 [Arthroderma sp. PD_2]